MTASAASSSIQPSEPSELLVVVQRYQQTYFAWYNERDSKRKAALRSELGLCQETLWDLLEGPLQHVARSWLSSGVGQEIRANAANAPCQQDALKSLAMHLYWPILEALPKLQVDPQKNLLACLMTIARRGISNENRRIYTTRPSHTQSHPIESAPESGTTTAAMWPLKTDDSNPVVRLEEVEHHADPVTSHLEEQLVTAIDRRCCWEEVLGFWQNALEQEDRLIISMRWQTMPPAEFKAVAQDMGPGWTEEAVRQRHSRVIRRTRKYLQEQGFL